MILALLMGLAFAQPATFVSSSPSPTVPVHVQQALQVLLPTSEPAVVSATPVRQSLQLHAAVPPHSVGHDAQRPEQALFLLALSELVPPSAMTPSDAGRLADRLYSEARRMLVRDAQLHHDACAAGRCGHPPSANPRARACMQRALPLYRRAATVTVRHPDRLAVRLAWAALLGDGDQNDLDTAATLIEQHPRGAWANEARLVLAQAWLHTPTWHVDRAHRALHDATDADPAWTSYATAWTYIAIGESGMGIDQLKRAVVTSNERPVLRRAALRDLVHVVLFLGEYDELFVHDTVRHRNGIARLALHYAVLYGRPHTATQLYRSLRDHLDDIEAIDMGLQLLVQRPRDRDEVQSYVLNRLSPLPDGFAKDVLERRAARILASSAATEHAALWGSDLKHLVPLYAEARALGLPPDHQGALRVLIDDADRSH